MNTLFLAVAIIGAVEDVGEPAPLGPIWLAISSQPEFNGLSLDQFNKLIEVLVSKRLLTRVGAHCVESGPEARR